MLTIAKALRITAPRTIAFAGAGGKTTAALQLAHELRPAFVTTTTHLGDWQVSAADRHAIWAPGEPMQDFEAFLGSGVTLVTGPLEPAGGRYQGLSLPQLESLRQLTGYHDLPLLIEADGARQRPLKAPAEHEPVIPDFADTVVVVAGLSALETPTDWDRVHRPDLFARLAGARVGDVIAPEHIVRVLTEPLGGLKHIPPQARRVALLNQADTPSLQAIGSQIAQALNSVYDSAIVASLAPPLPARPAIYAVHEKVAGIILAAGESRRFGRTKQLLDYHGRPFVRAVAQKAISGGLDPVIVVTGSDAEAVEAALAGLPLQIVRNPDWPSGQASSIRAGLGPLTGTPGSAGAAARRLPGAAIFLLSDMPQVTAEVLRALVEGHAHELPAVLAPMVEDRRGNPTLFDCATFPDLMRLSGDQGGRAIFSKYSPTYLPWLDVGLLRDVDTPADYESLMQHE
jgi:molybdenum cofactor cytidylyltransferase